MLLMMRGSRRRERLPISTRSGRQPARSMIASTLSLVHRIGMPDQDLRTNGVERLLGTLDTSTYAALSSVTARRKASTVAT